MRYICPEQAFPEYLRPAKTGESFIINSGGKAVFELKYI